MLVCTFFIFHMLKVHCVSVNISILLSKITSLQTKTVEVKHHLIWKYNRPADFPVAYNYLLRCSRFKNYILTSLMEMCLQRWLWSKEKIIYYYYFLTSACVSIKVAWLKLLHKHHGNLYSDTEKHHHHCCIRGCVFAFMFVLLPHTMCWKPRHKKIVVKTSQLVV